ncbi:4-hydroxybenzoate octaprenyltransferase [Pelagibaculum spongiae]|uniref:4-hydroxybenzoate octaprenyltransferase n=1 Tax=Pelagibaculum spongiae TaxID=2080658 RepID=A0A2V1H1Z5_9GAMM|nr:4-hydroxybenzoate octaprenyltransferase [Pelagibaculum spongiae]PVZ70462.1 4-hydroxybenzoate octaprenyltransferase [Pelagibaculum spongiae]
MLAKRIIAYGQLMRLDRPVGSLLLLWPTLWALWIAGNGMPKASVVAVFIAGVFLMRSAGCVINDYADRKVDGHVERTKNRPLASGRVTGTEALVLFGLLGLLALILVFTQNTLTIIMAFAGAVFATVYPFLKRYTNLPQLGLGIAFSWSVPMAFAAETATVPMIAWLVFVLNLIWTIAYDTQYAMVDRPDDLKIGIKSTAILFGNYDRLIVGILQALTLAGFWLLGWLEGYGIYYNSSLLLASTMVLWQQWLTRHCEPADCFRAFLNNSWLGGVIFCGLMLQYLA